MDSTPAAPSSRTEIDTGRARFVPRRLDGAVLAAGALALPPHTDGDCFIYFEGSDVLHLGDVFRTNMYPIVDVYNGGSYSGMIDALLLMMLDVRERVAELIARERTLAEVMQAGVTAEYDPRWLGVESWTEADLLPIVYDELKGQKRTRRPTNRLRERR